MNIRQRAEIFTRFVGLELKGKITAMGFTASAVAEAINRSPAAFNRWLNGKTEIPLSVVCEACEVIDIDPQVIVETAYSRLAVELGERDGSTYPEDDRLPMIPPASGRAVPKLTPILDVAPSPDTESSLTDDDLIGEDWDVTHEDVTKKDVDLVAKKGRKKADQPHAE
ncbi:helix-turn-helix domain-containing protein [Leifsonia poae]|uniref:helix-turn-helix domain-containing protein n=1 Tax=Leifsonia poae TaxID=110933 RepID=UPI001CBB8832|nr:helix-turn-helix transcriptional regulator [Leifsonia poae]